jgi:hypothetical protein
MTHDKLIARIEREAGVPGLAALLAERLGPTDLQSLLLEVYRRRAAGRDPGAVLADYERNRFVRPAAASPAILAAWERVAFDHLPAGFQPITLAPVCPLGTVSALADLDQNWAVSTVRNTEVVSDSTNVLALECAVQRRQLLRVDPKSTQAIHLAASHRLLRAQQFSGPHHVSHFSIFALCSAGRDQGGLRFEVATLALHISFYLRALRAFMGSGLPLHITLTDFGTQDRHALLEEQILAPLRAEFQAIEAGFDDRRTGGRGYYGDLCFHVDATTPDGTMLNLADGGVVDWTQRLLSNAKERLVTSGIGSERVCTAFGQRMEG